ncbi:MAG: 3-dehydroquinate synthase [Chloroflexota bacterium]
MTNIFLYGPPGSGKSALGQELARRLNLAWVELDAEIEKQAGVPIPQIFTEEGEGGFRRRERETLLSILTVDRPLVVSLGGGALLDTQNRLCTEAAGEIVCLSAPFEVLHQRIQVQDGLRPLLLGNAAMNLERLLAQRAEHYRSFEIQLNTEGQAVETLAWQTQIRLGMFHVTGMGSGYDVRVANKVVLKTGLALQERELRGPIALVSDSNVAPLHGERILENLSAHGYEARLVVIPAGEAYKTLDSVQRLWQMFLDQGIERSSTIVALGGGVLGDLSGFAAATYLRGVRWVAIPTSLLAMVDASLGGKTAADLPQGKNLVGAFHSPSLVLTDPGLLATLPEEEQRNGMAEVVKHGVIGDKSLFELCKRGWAAVQKDWEHVVRRACAVKIKVIEADPFERGERATLNLGHTLGHALEKVSQYELRHGEAVAIGMIAAARMAEKMRIASKGLADEIAATLSGLGLPTEIPKSLKQEDLTRAMLFDKKKKGGQVRFVLPESVGKARWGVVAESLDALFD